MPHATIRRKIETLRRAIWRGDTAPVGRGFAPRFAPVTPGRHAPGGRPRRAAGVRASRGGRRSPQTSGLPIAAWISATFGASSPSAAARFARYCRSASVSTVIAISAAE